jgi:putative SOS response-associated peptidase YedK
MPGRLILEAPPDELAALFAAVPFGPTSATVPADASPGSTVAAVVVEDGRRRLLPMRWGLIPMGRTNARGRPVLETIVNARAETLFTKSAFDGLHLALLPISGWCEWTGPRRRRKRWTIRAPDRPILAVAAVWDRWQAPGGASVASLATVTCAPNAEVACVHDRMPAILPPEGWPIWLGERPGDPAALLRPLPDGALTVSGAPD